MEGGRRKMAAPAHTSSDDSSEDDRPLVRHAVRAPPLMDLVAAAKQEVAAAEQNVAEAEDAVLAGKAPP